MTNTQPSVGWTAELQDAAVKEKKHVSIVVVVMEE